MHGQILIFYFPAFVSYNFGRIWNDEHLRNLGTNFIIISLLILTPLTNVFCVSYNVYLTDQLSKINKFLMY